ncbi:MAG: helix-turn-helix domain-containing protein [Monoglobaceae bacterium]
MADRPKISNEKMFGIVMEPIAVTVQNAAKLLGISDRTLYDMTNMEGFPAFKIGNRTLISVEGLREWVRDRVRPQGSISGRAQLAPTIER